MTEGVDKRDSQPVRDSAGTAGGVAEPVTRPAPDQDVEQSGPPTPARAFAARRAELGLSVEDVANQLKFAPRQIEALEAGDFARLPGGTFARGMVRVYARLLKLDPAPFLAQLSASGAPRQVAPEQAVSLRRPIPFSEGGKHANLVYVVLSVILLTAVVYFVTEWIQESSGVAKMAFVSTTRDAPAAEAQPAADPDKEPVAQPASEPAATPAGTPLVAAVPPAAQGAPRTATLASAAGAAIAETPRREERAASGPQSARGRIVMHFAKESWVEIKGANGATLLSQINPAGSEKVVEGNPPFSLVIGNAASVRLTYNEQPVDLRPYFKVDVARFKLD